MPNRPHSGEMSPAELLDNTVSGVEDVANGHSVVPANLVVPVDEEHDLFVPFILNYTRQLSTTRQI